MKPVIFIMLLLSLNIYAQDFTQFEEIKITNEDYGFEVSSYNAKDDSYSLEASFGAIANLSEFSQTNTISGVFTIYSSAFSYTIYGAINTLDIASVTPNTTTDGSLSVISAGGGLSRRSILINDFISINSIYDEIQTNFTYNMATSDELGVDLAGLGFNASYGLIWRMGSGVHLSARFVYNLMTLESSDDTTPLETTASWMSAQIGAAVIF